MDETGVVVQGERTLTELDFSRLTRLAHERQPPVLGDLLVNAEVVGSRAVRGDVVTMYSRVETVDAHTHRRQVLTICYPRDAEPAAGFISVLSPVGISLLGLKVGDVATWHAPHGEECAAVIDSVQFQPEAAGDYAT